MVGRDEGGGNQRQEMSCICFKQAREPICKARTRFSQCRCEALEQGTWAANGCSSYYFTAEAIAALSLDDAERGCPLLVGGTEDSAPSPVLCSGMVHWLTTRCDSGAEVVND